MRTPDQVLWEAKLGRLTKAPLVLVDDFYDLLQPTAKSAYPLAPPTGWDVLVAHSNLHFRALYEPHRRSGRRWLIVRKRPEVLLPDLEEQCAREGAHLRATPKSVLLWATGVVWPTEVDLCDTLVRNRFASILQAYQRWQQAPRGPFDAEQAADVLLSGVLEVSLFDRVEPISLWAAYFRQRTAIADVVKRWPLLQQRLDHHLSQRGAPLAWLAQGDAQVAAQMLWMLAFLDQYEQVPADALRALYPANLWLGGLESMEVQEFVEGLWAHAPDVVEEQVGWLDDLLRQRGIQVVLEQMGWDDQAAVEVLERERFSPFLVTLALRIWLLRWSQQGTLPGPLQRWLDARPSRLESLPHAGQAVRLHRQLGRVLSWLAKEGERVQALARQNAVAGAAELARLWPTFWTETGGAQMAQAFRQADALLKEDRLYAPSYQVVASEFPRRVSTWGWQFLADRRPRWESWLKAAERAILQEASSPSEGSLLRALDQVWEEANPTRRRGPSRLFLVAGLDWTLWSVLQEGASDHEAARAVTVPAPALPEILLLRWCARRRREPLPASFLSGGVVRWLQWGTGLDWVESGPDPQYHGLKAVWSTPGAEVWLWDWSEVLDPLEANDWLLGDRLVWDSAWQSLWRALQDSTDRDRWLLGWGGLQWARRPVPVPPEAVVAWLSPRALLLAQEVHLPTPGLFRPEDLDLPRVWSTAEGPRPVRAVALAVGEQRWVPEGAPSAEPCWALGGISPWEAVAPVLSLPAVQRSWEVQIDWQEPRMVAGLPGEEVEYVGWLTLRSGALLEVVEVMPGVAGTPAVSAALSLGEPRRVAFPLRIPAQEPPDGWFLFPIHLRWGHHERMVIGKVRVRLRS